MTRQEIIDARKSKAKLIGIKNKKTYILTADTEFYGPTKELVEVIKEDTGRKTNVLIDNVRAA